MEHLFGFQYEIINQITSYYYNELKPNLLQQFGSSDLLGNPNQMKRTLKKGFRKVAKIKNLKPGQVEQETKGLVHNASFLVGGVSGGFSRFAHSINK